MFFSYDEYNDYGQNYDYANEHCNIDYSLDVLVESYINDQTIFEAVLRRDFMEATGILTEASDDNFLVKMWDKICEFIETVKKKILEIYDSFCKKIDEHKKTKARKIVDKYKKYYNDSDASELLKEYTIKNFKLKTSVLKEKDSDKNVDIFEILATVGLSEAAKDMPYVDNISKDTLEKIQDDYESVSRNDIVDEFKKIYWEEDDIETPFAENTAAVVGGIQTSILTTTDTVRSIKKSKREFFQQMDKLKKDAKKKLASIRKDKYSDKDSKNEDKEKAQLYIKVISGIKKAVGCATSVLLKNYGKIYKECVRLYTGGGEFLKSKIERKKELDKKNKSTDTNNNDSTDSSSNNDSKPNNPSPSRPSIPINRGAMGHPTIFNKKDGEAFTAAMIGKYMYYDALGEAATLDLEELGLDFI